MTDVGSASIGVLALSHDDWAANIDCDCQRWQVISDQFGTQNFTPSPSQPSATKAL